MEKTPLKQTSVYPPPPPSPDSTSKNPRKYLFAIVIIAIVVIVSIIGAYSIANSGSSNSINPTTSPTIKPSSTPTNTPTIYISGNYQKLTQLSYLTPNSGYLYLEVNITIVDNGYSGNLWSFNTSPMFFFATANNVQYRPDYGAMIITNNWQDVTLQDQGTFSGTIIFQIPSSSNDISFGYYFDSFQTWNIKWNING